MEKIIEQIQDISDSVIGWDIDTMQGFLQLKEIEKTLKQAVELSKQNKTLNDEDWMVIEVPEYKMKESFMVSKRR